MDSKRGRTVVILFMLMICLAVLCSCSNNTPPPTTSSLSISNLNYSIQSKANERFLEYDFILTNNSAKEIFIDSVEPVIPEAGLVDLKNALKKSISPQSFLNVSGSIKIPNDLKYTISGVSISSTEHFIIHTN